MNFKIPESIVQDLKSRQQIIITASNEFNLIVKTAVAMISNSSTYILSDDLTELIEVIEKPKQEV